MAGNAEAPLWCLARNQTAGKGRRSRPWVFREGNFAASYLCRPEISPAEYSRYSFVAALALYDALAEFVGRDGLGLKWPNDILFNGCKISGILLETVAMPRGMGLIVGVGVNLVSAPSPEDIEHSALQAVSLSEIIGRKIPPEDFLNQLAPSFAAREAQLNRGAFSEIRTHWLARALGIGKPIRARLPHAEHNGIFEDIDGDGALILRTAQGRLVLPAADVYWDSESGE